MIRRGRNRILAALATCTLAACGSSTPGPNPDAPNIVMVMTDDQAIDDMRAMPLTRSVIGDHGVTFANSFVSWPLCCPSRTTTFTGQYAHNHRVLGNYPPDGGSYAFTTDDDALAVWLTRAGYATSHIGKYLNFYGFDDRGPNYVPPGWSAWRGTVDPSTYSMWGYTVNHDGELTTYGTADDEDPALYQTDVLAGFALDEIDRLSALGKPFFLSVAFLAPHEETQENASNAGPPPGPRPAPRHAGSFAGTPLPHPPNFDEADLSDKPPVVAQFGQLHGDDTMEQRTRRYQRRLESLRAVDEAVQAIVNRLAERGVLDRTYIVFTSDNGFFNGEHHIPFGKYLMYEPSIRVPLLIRGPSIPEGQTSQELVVNVDLAATFVDLARARPGRALDGRSLMTYARDPELISDRPVLLDAPHDQVVRGTHDGEQTTLDVPPLLGLRTARYSYVEYGTGEVELYDLIADPWQLQSSHDDPAYAGVRAALHDALSRYQQCAGDSCRSGLELPAQ